jgi:hypothetical protein
MKKKPLLIQLDEIEREKVERLAVVWGLSLAGTIRRLIREQNEDV